MTAQPHLLAPIDLSPWSIRTLDTATSMAEILGAKLHILHVAESSEDFRIAQSLTGPCNPEAVPAIEPEGEEVPPEDPMQVFRSYINRLINVHAEFDLRVGTDVVNEIKKKADEIENLAMIILGTHGKTGNLSQLMGHVPHRLVQETHYPVLLTRKNMNIPIELKHILIPLDGSTPPASVIPVASQLADISGGTIDLFHVIESDIHLHHEPERLTPPRYMDHPQYDWTEWEHVFMERFVQPRKHPESTTPYRLHVGHGDVDGAILKFARQHHTDLIAMGWHGHLEPRRARVLKEILLASECPILLYHEETDQPEGDTSLASETGRPVEVAGPVR